jgi:hypothetical protein
MFELFDSTCFYSTRTPCARGLRGRPFGLFLVFLLAASLHKIRSISTVGALLESAAAS